MDAIQEKKFLNRLIGKRDPATARKLFGQKSVRNVYVPPTRGVDGSSVVMSKN